VYKVEVNIPAAITNIGPGYQILGLAVNLHCHIEMMLRNDGALNIHLEGEGRESISTSFDNPVLQAAIHLFQSREMAPAGLDILIKNHIPLGVGMNAEAAMMIGGLVAANNLIEPDYNRETIIRLAMGMGLQRIEAVTTLLGGLNICVMDGGGNPLHKSLEPPPLKLVVIVPDIPDYEENTRHALPEKVALDDAIFNMGSLVFMIDALVAGDFAMLRHTLQDRLFQKGFTDHIPGFEAAVTAARAHNGVVTLAGHGPTLLAFAPFNHALIAEEMGAAFRAAGVKHCRHWTLGIDAQGVTVSMVS
jgi:homoserine kinase